MLPGEQDINVFLDDVLEVSRLIQGLKAGTISPDYVDSKIQAKTDKKASGRAAKQQSSPVQACHKEEQKQQQQQQGPKKDAAHQAELQKKVEELKANRQRKLRARQLYEQHTQSDQCQLYATDYRKWNLWCPSDDEDDLFNSCTPNTPEFRAMEKDITERHSRMVEQRQVAERQRQLGNTAFKGKQYSEALRCYELGLEAQRHNMALHANAAMAALKLKCYVQALEHCDKVLHLAEVLFNTPKHVLCVKALQRRAAAYQGLEQHAKAVADLEAAAALLPEDNEIQHQLQTALMLQEEQKSVKTLKHLVATASKGSMGCQQPHAINSSSSSSRSDGDTGPDLARLQSVEQLTKSLNLAGAAAPSDPCTSIAATCSELQGLALQDSHCNTYFRECGGLDALSKLVSKLEEPADLAAAMLLLAAASDNPTTLQHLCSQHVLLLAAVLDHLTSTAAGPEAATAAAAELACTASATVPTRQTIAQQLLLPPEVLAQRQKQQQQQQEVHDLSRLEQLWMFACSSQKPANTKIQALVLSLLSNCLLVPAVREATAALLQHRPAALDDMCRLIHDNSSSSCSSSRGGSASAVAEKLMGLMSNASSHAGMRKQLAEHGSLVQQILAVALPCSSHHLQVTSSAAAAMGCLCNLSLEACVQLQLAEQPLVTRLLQLAVTGFTTSSSSICSTENRTAEGLGTQLPCRKRVAQQQQQPAEVAAAFRQQRQQAATLLSRAAKCAAGLQLLQKEGTLDKLLQALACCLQQQQQDGKVADCTAWVEAVMRTIALLTAAPGKCTSCSEAQASAAVDVCLQLLRADAVAPASVKGNAALCLSHFAGEQQWHKLLCQADAVGVLVQVAHKGRGDACSKNAAIALAKMARDDRMMERLRELHGLEIIYQYVRP